MALKTDYKDDILDVSQNTKRKYTMIENQDGTVSFDDETVYTQEGDSFGASDINAITEAVNNNSGMPVGTIATFDGTTLPSGFEPYQTEEQRAIAQINDNLSGFKFYPSGTSIVGLIADDSAYTDADGNYVVWGTPTANQLVEDNPNTYKSVPSEEDTRGEVGADTAIPFSGGVDTDTTFHTSVTIPQYKMSTTNVQTNLDYISELDILSGVSSSGNATIYNLSFNNNDNKTLSSQSYCTVSAGSTDTISATFSKLKNGLREDTVTRTFAISSSTVSILSNLTTVMGIKSLTISKTDSNSPIARRVRLNGNSLDLELIAHHANTLTVTVVFVGK